MEKFIAYYSNLPTWHRMSNQYFWKPELKPDLIVVTYYDGNASPTRRSWTSATSPCFLPTPEDRASLFEHELTTLEHRSRLPALVRVAGIRGAGPDPRPHA